MFEKFGAKTGSGMQERYILKTQNVFQKILAIILAN